MGQSRYRPAGPPPRWDGVRDATRFGAAAPQPSGEGVLSAPPKVMDEDCLTLNVTTPAADGGRRPVLVWIHGGGFRTGTGAIPWYDGTSFCTNGDIVVVSINYRLGALGYLHLEDAGRPAAGSAGLADQVAALRWVRDHIASFGGDPASITVAGESAGAMSVGALLGSPATAGLFQRAILQSGAADHCVDRTTAGRVADRFLVELGAVRGTAPGGRSRDPYEADVDAVLAAQVATEQALARDAEVRTVSGISNLGMVFQPVVGTDLLPEPPLHAVGDGAGAGVDVMIGTNLDEMSIFGRPRTDEAALHRHLDAMLGDGRAAEAAAAYRLRLGRDAAPVDVLLAARTDHVFRAPAIRLAEAHRGSTWTYLFTWESWVPGLGSAHALEIPFVFDNLHQPGVEPFLGAGPSPQALADAVHHAWIGFVRDGDPGWDRYEPGRRTTMVFGDGTSPEDDPLGAERGLWSTG